MMQKEQLYYLIKAYMNNEYDTKTFSDLFTDTFYLENDNQLLTTLEKKLFEELAIVTSRFSPYEEDLKIPNVYFNESQVKSKVQEVIQQLNSIN